MKAYLASGWFNPAQENDLTLMKTACRMAWLSFYSPKDEMLAAPDSSPEARKTVFDSNVKAIEECDLVIVNTRDKDVGSVFEAGVAYVLKKPIVYFWSDGSDEKVFNLMLSESGRGVAYDLQVLAELLRRLTHSEETLRSFSQTRQGRIE